VSDPASIPRMTADEFITWTMNQPEGERYELAGGEVIAAAPERVSHARAKLHMTRRLIAAIDASGADSKHSWMVWPSSSIPRPFMNPMPWSDAAQASTAR
jgi:hypothetical protein